MKKRYIFIIVSAIYMAIILIIKVPKAMDSAVDKAIEQNHDFVHGYNICDVALKQERYRTASKCFGELLQKYDRPDVRYNYAVALAQIRDYGAAKRELEIIMDNSQNPPEIIDLSKKLNKQIDDILNKMRNEAKSLDDVKQKNLDVGDYFSDLDEYTRWEHPENITVYIKDDTKKDLYEAAFAQWNLSLDGVIHFEIINHKKADIICSFVNKTKGDEGGYTDWYYIEKNGIKYFDNAKIQVSRRSPQNGEELTDKQIYSIILHEIGHALGISGHSPFKGDIMYYSTEGFLNEKYMISNRDIKTIKKIYKNQPAQNKIAIPKLMK